MRDSDWLRCFAGTSTLAGRGCRFVHLDPWSKIDLSRCTADPIPDDRIWGFWIDVSEAAYCVPAGRISENYTVSIWRSLGLEVTVHGIGVDMVSQNRTAGRW